MDDNKSKYENGVSELREKARQLERAYREVCKQRDQALEQVSFLQAIIDGCDDILQIVGHDGHLKFVSKSMEKHSGFSLDEIKGIDIRSLYPPKELDRISQLLAELSQREPGGQELLTHMVLDKYGTIKTIETNAVNCPDDPINGVICVSRDITARQNSIEGLKDSDDALRTVFNAVEEGILIHTLDGEILYVNEKVLDLHSITKTNAINSFDAQDLYIPGHVNRSKVREMWNGIISGAPRSFEWNIIRKSNNAHLDLEIYLTRIKLGDQYQILASLRDITSRKSSEKLSSALQEIIEDLNRMESLSEALDICVEAALTLPNVDAVGLYLINNDGDLELKIARGLSDDFLRKVSFVGRDSQSMRSLASSEGLYSDLNFPEEHMENLKEEGIKAAIAIPIKKDGKLLGSFNVGSHDIHSFPQEEKTALSLITSKIGDSFFRIRSQEALKISEQRLKASLKEKETLLREIHHRIKNNLSTIAGLLRLQSRRSHNKEVRSMLDESAMRVTSMGLVHEKLYLSRNLSDLNAKVYFDSLIKEIVESHGQIGSGVKVISKVDSIEMGVDIAAPLGMIVTELVSNSLKHGFPGGGPGEIIVDLKIDDKNTTTLTVEDNGIGMKSTDTEHSSLGIKLVEIFAQQIDAKVTIESTNGVKVIVIL